MSRDDERCAGCGATWPRTAPWCTQCYRTERGPVELSVEPPAPSVAAVPLPRPGGELSLPAAVPVAARGALPEQRRPTVAPFWPCPRCTATNALSAACCVGCGAPFLAPDPRPSLVVPGLGDVAGLSTGRRYALAAGIAVLLAAVPALLSLLG